MNASIRPSEKTPSPKGSKTVTLAFFSPKVDFECDDPNCLDVTTLSQERFWAMHLAAEAKGQSLTEWIEDAIRAKLQPFIDLDNPKSSKGFVQINLSEGEQKELRALARACRMPLNQALRNALRDVQMELRRMGKITRLTGMGAFDQHRFFGYLNKSN